ncbi:MAG TPA: DNA-3-methyladenine glycosylase, partial [Coriobacteriia bacterium]
SFFARDTVTVARELLGKVLVSRAGETVTGGRIVETEAYLGAHDAGSHAATKGVTKRNAVMYGPPGRAYVYFTYGNHHMLNLVTEPDGTAGAVLIRALEPLQGVDEMLRRRAANARGGEPRPMRERDLCNGPGKLAAALGVDLTFNGCELGKDRLVVYDAPAPSEPILASGRIGLTAGHELDLRFYLEGDPHVSKGRVGPKPPHPRREKGT